MSVSSVCLSVCVDKELNDHQLQCIIGVCGGRNEKVKCQNLSVVIIFYLQVLLTS